MFLNLPENVYVFMSGCTCIKNVYGSDVSISHISRGHIVPLANSAFKGQHEHEAHQDHLIPYT